MTRRILAMVLFVLGSLASRGAAQDARPTIDSSGAPTPAHPTRNGTFYGGSIARATSTVDWQSRVPVHPCEMCLLDIAPNKERESWAPGIMLATRASKLVGFSTEARYTLKGFDVTEPRLNVHYLEIPALVRIGPLASSNAFALPVFEAGPAFALNVHCEIDVGPSARSCAKQQGPDGLTIPGIRRYDLSFVFGGGIALRFSEDIAIVGVRVDHGLLDIGGEASWATKNRSALLYLGWLSPIH